MASNRSKDQTFFLLMICFYTCSIPEINCFDVGAANSNSKESSPPIRQGDLIPREKILNHALASAEMALNHVKENWIPLFDKNVVLDDPSGSHEFKGEFYLLIYVTYFQGIIIKFNIG